VVQLKLEVIKEIWAELTKQKAESPVEMTTKDDMLARYWPLSDLHEGRMPCHLRFWWNAPHSL
jgi:hypothetical protein